MKSIIIITIIFLLFFINPSNHTKINQSSSSHLKTTEIQNTLHESNQSHYSHFYHRAHPNLKPFIILLFILWIIFLFAFVGIVASDFFCPNLSTISSRLNLSESLAGVTLLGFGNGAPDVFSTYAAFKSNTGSLAIGELIGASLFIVSVVVGTMSIVRPFKVPRHSFLRDLIFFIIAIIFVLIIILDRAISPWQANALVLIYLTYVLSVLLSSWSLKRIQSKRDQVRIARSHYSHHDQLLEPYHDDPDFPIQPIPEDNHQSPLVGRNHQEDHATTTLNRPSPQLSPLSQPRPPQRRQKSSSTCSSSHSDSFKTLLKTSYPISVPVGNRRMRAPSISYQSNVIGPSPINLINSTPSSSPSDSPNLSHLHLHRSRSNESPQAVMTTPDNPKRRPRSNTIMINGPIRPSLLGAVEFRDVVNSLARDATVHGTARSTSPHLTHRRRSSCRHPRSDEISVELFRGNHSNPSVEPTHRIASIHQPACTSSDHRINQLTNFRFESRTENSNDSRTLGHRKSSKSDDFRSTHQVSNSTRFDSSCLRNSLDSELDQGQLNQEEGAGGSDHLLSNSNPRKSQVDDRFQSSSPLQKPQSTNPSSLLPSILITNDRQEIIQLPDTPTIDVTHDQHQIHPPNARLDAHQLDARALRSQEEKKRRREWMKMVGTIWKTLFPTLKDWRMKSKLGIFLAMFSAPAVFVLTLTLPVVVDEVEENVESEGDDEDEQVDDEEGMNDIKVSQDDSTGSRFFSSLFLHQNQSHGRPHEEVGLGLGCVVEEEEDSTPNHRDARSKQYSDPELDYDRGLDHSTVLIGNMGQDEEGGVILREQVQERGDYDDDDDDDDNNNNNNNNDDDDDDDDKRDRYSNQDIACILATIQTFLTPPFWVICLLDHNDDHPLDASRVDNDLLNSNKLYQNVQVVLSNSASHTFWIELITSFLIGSVLSKIVFETLRSKDQGRVLDNVGQDENNILTRLKSKVIITRLNIKKIIKIGLCLIGFINSMVYILLIVNQLIEILKFFAAIFHISDSILGLTIFGIGNSLGDFVANFTVAKMGFPVMAISACFGGPMLNILLGIGVSARLVISSTTKLKEEGMNSSSLSSMVVHRKGVIKIESSTSLLISTVGLLMILMTMLILIPLKKSFLFDRSVGFSLILSYSFVFLINVLVEIFF